MGSGWGGQDGCERIIEVFEKIHHNSGLGGCQGAGNSKYFFLGGGGVRVDVHEELKFLRKFTKNSGLGVVGGGWCSGLGGDRVGGVWGGCGQRIEVFVKKKSLKKKIGGGGGRGRVGEGSGWGEVRRSCWM